MPATEVLHVYKPICAGQFRGQPWLTSVIAKLYELEQYTDAEIVRKKLAAMITGFITQASPDNPIIPPDQYQNGPTQTDPGTQISKLEPGTFQVLNFGEEVQFAEAKDSGDFKSFIGRACKLFRVAPGLPSIRSAVTCRGSTILRSAPACWSSAASASSINIRFSSSRSATRFISAGCARRCWRWCSALIY